MAWRLNYMWYIRKEKKQLKKKFYKRKAKIKSGIINWDI